MTYKQTVDYLYSKLPLFSRVGSIAYKEDITNTVLLCKSLDDPHLKFRTIHIAGTNGKGSTSHMLAAVLQNAGYKTGLYTSPHLKDFRERIRINGEMISEAFIVEFVDRSRKISEEIQPSFFELTVAMAFDLFAREKIDIAVIETGLGGRLDSTNIITPVLSIITNIGYDHQNILGNSLEEIATEKAGIIKKNIPVVIGETTASTKVIFLEKSKLENSPIVFSEDHFEVIKTVYRPFSLHIQIKEVNTSNTLAYDLDLNGIYQQKNLATVLTSITELNKLGFNIQDANARLALSQVKKLTGLRGRWDVIQDNPHVILDVAHNEDGIRQVLHQLSILEYDALHIVIGMVRDKDQGRILSMMPVNAKYYFTNAGIPRALPADELMKMAAAFKLEGDHYSNVNLALDAAKKVANNKDLILVCGSVFVVGEVNN